MPFMPLKSSTLKGVVVKKQHGVVVSYNYLVLLRTSAIIICGCLIVIAFVVITFVVNTSTSLNQLPTLG